MEETKGDQRIESMTDSTAALSLEGTAGKTPVAVPGMSSVVEPAVSANHKEEEEPAFEMKDAMPAVSIENMQKTLNINKKNKPVLNTKIDYYGSFQGPIIVGKPNSPEKGGFTHAGKSK